MHLALIWYILRQNLTVRKQSLLVSGPLLIMRLNYYSKAFGCVGFFQAQRPSKQFFSHVGTEATLILFYFFLFFFFCGGEDGGCGASARSRIIKLEKP